MELTKTTNNNQQEFQAIEWEGEITEDTLGCLYGGDNGLLGRSIDTAQVAVDGGHQSVQQAADDAQVLL